MKYYKEKILERMRAVLIIIILFCFFSCLLNRFLDINLMNVRKFISSSCKDNVITFLEICIGIYATVVTLLASQRTCFTVRLSQKALDYRFVAVISIGMILNILTSLLLSIISTINLVAFSITMILCILSVGYFAEFLVLLVIMFCYNMDAIADENKSDIEYKNKILTNLEEIRKNK